MTNLLVHGGGGGRWMALYTLSKNDVIGVTSTCCYLLSYIVLCFSLFPNPDVLFGFFTV